ncbi:hypothetical protein SAMN05660464_1234 [Geodermatophilus dictyosporus]|uniref:Phosphoglyceromutase n=1 Tax=Geodermatophilus dictyosporus TaxID=1523247 RepID=A0A1I5K2X9_9ACTN|nr:hypothetical protein [Geodermatophilus dictyosporus]SFO79412.1 hypothetical protein SAMN05660464_1234 [Geodermatophilus dictyosporus]
MRRAVLLLVAVLALLVTGLPGAAAADDAAGEWRADRVLVVGVPGLLWSDLEPGRTPSLWDLAETSPMGAVSVRAARSTTCLLDGWATLGAGNRARFPSPDEALPQVPVPTVPLPGEVPGEAEGTPTPQAVPAGPPASPELSFCGLQERLAEAGLADPLTAVRAVAEDRATARFGAEPAVLGEAVGCATVVGRAPVVAVAAPGVGLNRQEQLPADPAAVAELLEPCPLTLVSLDGLVDAGVPADGSETGTEPQSREAALADVDAAVGALRAAVAALPGDTLLLLQGVSEVNDGRPQLHVGLASGPGFTGPGWLTSASTGRAPYTQLIDVAPTALRALGLPRPASVNGQPLTVTGEHPGTAEAVATLVRANTAAVTHHRSTGTFYAALVAVDAAVVAFGLLVLGSRRGAPVRPSRGRLRPVLHLAALAAAALPVATYLAGLVPWERAGSPRWALAGAVLLADAAVLAVALLGPWRRGTSERRRRLGPLLAVLGVTVATLAGDVLTGSRLELDGLLGYDPIVAGRFTGYGNLTAGLLAGAALPATAALATAAGRRAGRGRDDGGRRQRRVTGAVVLAAGAVTVVLVGTPGLGRDFGGVLALLPGFLLLAMLLTGVRVTVVRMGAVLAAGVLAVGTLAVLDWLRPADERSHLGRFVEQVLTGEAWTVVSRKAQANLDILLGSSLSWVLPVALVAAVWLVRRTGPRGAGPGLLRAGGSGLRPADAAVLRAGLLAAALSLALGAAVNDSGVALPATAAALLVPLLVALAARAPRRDADVAARGPGEGDDRVTVGSRGSTWNI